MRYLSHYDIGLSGIQSHAAFAVRPASAAARMAAMLRPSSSGISTEPPVKAAEPATSTSAPASCTAAPFPVSLRRRFRSGSGGADHAFDAGDLLDLASMKDWPPKPGLTVITSTRSTASSTIRGAFRRPRVQRTPAFLPRARTLQRAVDMRARLGVDGDDVRAGLDETFDIGIDRCDHQMHVERPLVCGGCAAGRRADVMLGTKWPSITSTWTQSRPAASMARTRRRNGRNRRTISRARF